MATSLYDLSVASYLQALDGVTGFLDKGAAHAQESGLVLDEIVATRLRPDMLPFSFQVFSVTHHTLGAINGIREGAFGPPANLPTLDYAGLQKLVADTRLTLEAMSKESVNEMAGKKLTFNIGENKIPFNAENFVLSFSLPNLHFHAATAYDILRMNGTSIGKRDFMGPMRLDV